MNKLMPRQPVPELKVPTLQGTTWRLAEVTSEQFTLVVFYRGLHCPICRTYLGELDKLAADFKSRGVEIIAISSDVEERARQTKKDWGLANLILGYGLDLDVARQWGLYVSSKSNKEITQALQSADVRAGFTRSGTDAVSSTPEQFGAFIKTEHAKWGKVIKGAGVQIN